VSAMAGIKAILDENIPERRELLRKCGSIILLSSQ